MLVPRVCAPRVTRFSLGRYWSRDLCSKQAAERLTGWLCIETVILSRSDRLPRQRNLMTHAQCPLPVYSSQVAKVEYAGDGGCALPKSDDVIRIDNCIP